MLISHKISFNITKAKNR